jgi:PEP-CTERM motif
MHRIQFVVVALGLPLLAPPAFAASILPSATGTAASNSGWVAPLGSGNHTHGSFVNAGEMGVEEERGIVEFNLGAQSPLASVVLLFDNAPFQTCCAAGVTGGSYSIGVYAYAGNNAFAFTDFDVVTPFFLGSFSTAGMVVGQQFSFDVTAAFNANAGGSLGIRLQALSEPGQTSYTFNNFELDTDPQVAVPEPGTMLLLGTGLAGAAVRFRRRRAAGATS